MHVFFFFIISNSSECRIDVCCVFPFYLQSDMPITFSKLELRELNGKFADLSATTLEMGPIAIYCDNDHLKLENCLFFVARY